MRRGCAAVALIVTAVVVAAVPAADASGPLTLKRSFDRVGEVKIEGHRYSSRLILSSPKGPVGTARYTCIDRRQGLPHCSVNSKFSEGRIRARGRLSSRGTLPIVGGSGAFRNARGDVAFGKSGRHAAFIYRLDSFG